MRKLLGYLVLAVGYFIGSSTANADTNFNAYWYLSDFTQTAQTNRPVNVYPVARFTSFSTNIITGDRITNRTDAHGYFVISNMTPGRYIVEVLGRTTITTFTNVFTNGTSGYVNAKDFPNISTNVDGTQRAYSQAQANALFVSKSSGVATNLSTYGTLNHGGNAVVRSNIYADSAIITNNLSVPSGTATFSHNAIVGQTLSAGEVDAPTINATGGFIGDGSQITDTDAGALASGVMSHERLPAKQFGFQNYKYFPMGFDHWVTFGSSFNETALSNKLITISNLNLTAFTPPGTRFMIFIQEWTTNTGRVNGHLPVDYSRWPKGITNAFRLADLYNCDIGLYLEPRDSTSAGMTGMGTDFETTASDIASWFQTWGNSKGYGAVGIRFDQPSDGNITGDEVRMTNLRKFAGLMRSAVSNNPVYFYSAGWYMTNSAMLSAAPPGTMIRGHGDWGNYNTSGFGNWTNNFLQDVIYRLDHVFRNVGGDGVSFSSEMCENNVGNISSVQQLVVGAWAMLGMSQIFTYVDDSTYLTNRDINAIFQDSYTAARPLPFNTNVWVKPTGDGGYWVSMLNRGTNTALSIGFNLEALGFYPNQNCTIRDLWAQTETNTVGTYTNSALAPMTLQVLKVSSSRRYSSVSNEIFRAGSGGFNTLAISTNGRVSIDHQIPTAMLDVHETDGTVNALRLQKNTAAALDMAILDAYSGYFSMTMIQSGVGMLFTGPGGRMFIISPTLFQSDIALKGMSTFESAGAATMDSTTELKGATTIESTLGVNGRSDFTNFIVIRSNPPSAIPALQNGNGTLWVSNNSGDLYWVSTVGGVSTTNLLKAH